MNKLSVCFAGLGSISKKHIRDLKMLCRMKNIDLTIDVLRRRNNYEREYYNQLGINSVFTDKNDINKFYDVLFITNPTDKHISVLKDMESYAQNFFIEKPISSVPQIKEAEKIRPKQDGIYYVACPLRYCPVIQYLKNNIKNYDIISIRCISSSYLPEWRPGIDYRKNYSAHKEQGGGVDIDLIHEWDYITYLFGMPSKIKSMIGKKSNLEIDSNDYALYIAEYDDKIIELHLDYFGRKRIREIMLFTSEDTIIGDIENNEIHYLKSGKVIKLDNQYNNLQYEMKYFLDLLDNKVTEYNNIEQAVKVLRLTQGEL